MFAVVEQMERQTPKSGELEALLAAVAAGDREALARLYGLTRGAVYGAALAVLKNAHDAQEIAQDAFVRIWESAGRYRPKGSPMAWILTITRNLALMRLRGEKRQVELSEEEWDAIPSDAPGVTPEDRLLLQTALSALSSLERQVVLLHAASGLKHREIAELLDMPTSTVLSKYHRAIKKMRDLLEGDARP